jgi:hypothetical protein
MNKLQTVLDALEKAKRQVIHANIAPHGCINEAITIVKEMMAQEPVAWVLFRRDDDGLEPVIFYGGKEKPEGEFKDRFELHSVHINAAPQASPVAASLYLWSKRF